MFFFCSSRKSQFALNNTIFARQESMNQDQELAEAFVRGLCVYLR